MEKKSLPELDTVERNHQIQGGMRYTNSYSSGYYPPGSSVHNARIIPTQVTQTKAKLWHDNQPEFVAIDEPLHRKSVKDLKNYLREEERFVPLAVAFSYCGPNIFQTFGEQP